MTLANYRKNVASILLNTYEIEEAKVDAAMAEYRSEIEDEYLADVADTVCAMWISELLKP